MKDQIVIPSFKTEAEEAEWLYQHRDELAADFQERLKAKGTGSGSLARLRALHGARPVAAQS